MTRTICCASFVLICYLSTSAQITFQKILADTGPQLNKPVRHSYCINTTNDGGYIMGVNTTPTCLGHATIIKADANGDTIWTRTFDFNGTENVYSIEQTTDGGYIVGITDGTIRAIKIDATGNLIWSKQYDLGSSGNITVHQTSDGGYIIGCGTSLGAGMGDGRLIKTTATGDTLWARTYGGTQSDDFKTAIQTSDGGYIAVGRTRSFAVGGGIMDGYVVKTNSTGDTLWTRVYGTPSTDDIRCVLQTNGGYVFAGTRDFKIILFKTSPTGNILWTRQFTDSSGNADYSLALASAPDGGFAITGSSMNSGNGMDVFLLKTDTAGNYQWSKFYGGLGIDHGYSLQSTQDGGYIISGSYYGPQGCNAPEAGAYLIKVDASGTSPCKSSAANFIQSSFSFMIGQGAIVGRGGVVNTAIPIVSYTYFEDSTFCFFVGENELNNIYDFINVYPNPSNGKFIIEAKGDLIIYNLLGEIIISQRIVSDKTEIDLRGEAKGIYFILVNSGKGIVTKRIVIQ